MKRYPWVSKDWQGEYKEILEQVSLYPTGQGTVRSDEKEDIEIFLEEAYLVPALMGEAGEVASIYAKLIRDNKGRIDDEDIEKVIKELGDVLFFVSRLASLYGYNLSDVAAINALKLLTRLEKGCIQGSGDSREENI